MRMFSAATRFFPSLRTSLGVVGVRIRWGIFVSSVHCILYKLLTKKVSFGKVKSVWATDLILFSSISFKCIVISFTLFSFFMRWSKRFSNMILSSKKYVPVVLLYWRLPMLFFWYPSTLLNVCHNWLALFDWFSFFYDLWGVLSCLA